MKEIYDVLVSRLEGLSSWGTKISIGGWTLEFGRRFEQDGMTLGEFTVWVRTRFRVAVNRKLAIESEYPVEEGLTKLLALLEDKPVTRASIDRSNNSLRLLFGEDCLLSVFPGPSNSEMPWIIFNNTVRPRGNLVVYADCFRGSLAE